MTINSVTPNNKKKKKSAALPETIFKQTPSFSSSSSSSRIISPTFFFSFSPLLSRQTDQTDNMSRTSASQFHTILPQRLYIRPRITPQLLLPLLLRKANSGSKGAKPAVPHPALEPIQIPAPLLLSAHKSGASPYAPGAAQALMNEYARRTSSPASRALGLEFCKDHGTTGEDLTSLARLLLRSNNAAGGFALLRHLLRTCAHMDVPAAVVHLHVLLSAQVARGGGSVLVQAELEGVRKRLAKVAPGHAGGL
ncbi:hypothetical protein L873DRAFT_729458 [Choiromyces venosus 120613-1]|uniref:Uncharacterized protein n=1 Tax=Choiromyces venosus 120613-1 TaxID=1336337 RepID=A0A3N4K552_9PEZI|nr:hypothetical protein L873DRAFT_729458 [Choiromyces venosus 120613-1]